MSSIPTFTRGDNGISAERRTYTIHPAATIFPALSSAELRDLAADIRTHGLREPIVLLDGAMLDGRHRQLACDMVGIEPQYRELTADDVGDPVEYVASANLHRRHLSTSQRALVAARLVRYRESRPAQNCAGRARDRVAPLLGVSSRSVDHGVALLERGSDALVAAVERGDVAISRAAEIARDYPAEYHADIATSRRRPLRELVLAALADEQPRRTDDVLAAVRRADPAVSWRLIARELERMRRRPPAGSRLLRPTDNGDGWRLVANAQQPMSESLRCYRELMALLDEIEAYGRGEYDLLYSTMSPLDMLRVATTRIRAAADSVIRAASRESARTGKVPGSMLEFREIKSIEPLRRRLLLPR